MSILAIDTVGIGSSIAIVDYDGNCFVAQFRQQQSCRIIFSNSEYFV